MRGRTFGSAPDRWSLGLWCEERPWTWSAGLQPVRAMLRCPSGGTRAWRIEYLGLWPVGRCDCGELWSEHAVTAAHLETVGEIARSPLLLLEETLHPGDMGDPLHWRALHTGWFPGAGAMHPGATARKAAIAVAAILTHRARATAARPIVQRMMTMTGRDLLSLAMVRSMVRPLGIVTERARGVVNTLDAYGTMHTPSNEPGPRGIGDVIGPYALAAVRAIALGDATVETDDPYLSRYMEWLKEGR